MDYGEKILELADLVELRRDLADAGKSVVQCHGCFDIVHPGHIRYLRYARSLGDVLVVSITSDRSIDKGYDRPYIHQELRAENLAALQFVDYVCVDANPTAAEVLEAIRPDVYVKGKEYETSSDPRFLREREIVEGHGGKVIFSSGDVVFSSTRLLERIRQELPMEAEKIRVFCGTHGITRESVAETLKRFSGTRVVVVGDPILDRYIHSEEMTVASESPVISVAPVDQQSFIGGAGLIASQLVELGADATLLTTMGPGAAADTYREALSKTGVTLSAIESEIRPTFVKTRYLVEEQKVFKVDEGGRSPLPSNRIDEIEERLGELLEGADLLLVTDFGYGMFGAQLVDAILRTTSAAGVPYALDVSRSGSANLLKFRAPRLVTPTEDELRFAFGDLESGLSHLAARFYQQTDAERLMLTMGRKGVLHFARPSGSRERLVADYLPAFNTRPVDAVGAGDVFLSAAALADTTGASPQMGMYLGTALAGLHVARLGNAPTTNVQLSEYVQHRPELDS